VLERRDVAIGTASPPRNIENGQRNDITENPEPSCPHSTIADVVARMFFRRAAGMFEKPIF
jgi:hypothetical protein